MKTKQFKAESKRLLDLMIHSIYTHKEIFLRELISNASDALDKCYYRVLTDDAVPFTRDSFFVTLTVDKQARTLTVSDTGVGMTPEELESNLGTIAQSGSLTFRKDNAPMEGVDIIGQFGVGFYSAFMVSDLVAVRSRTLDGDAFEWRSAGSEGYTIAPCDKHERGTDVILTLKANTEDEDYDQFLDERRLKALVKKYSDFIKYPIRLSVPHRSLKEGSDKEYEDVWEEETLNSMVPIWRKNKNELTDEDYDSFYRDKHFGFDKPLRHIHTSVDGVTSYTAVLYIPAQTPFGYYSKSFEKGLELYSNGVLIMNKCADLLPDHFSFVQGLVDSADLSLNISRELLQHDRQLKFIAKKIGDKIRGELLSMLQNEREAYETFFGSFGLQLKYGLHTGMGMNNETLQDLLVFYSSTENKLVTLGEYVSRMKDDQKYIYYATGDSVDRIRKMPQTEMLADRGVEILYLTEDVDEFAIKVLHAYGEKEFRNVSGGDLGLEETEKAPDEQDKALFDDMQKVLDGKVGLVRVSQRLKTHPVCLASQGDLSIDMEKVLSALPEAKGITADKVLELNAHHDVFAALKAAHAADRAKFEFYTRLLYNQALLMEGLPMDDPQSFVDDVCSLMS